MDKLESVSILEQSYDGLCKLFIRRLEVLAQYTKVIVFLDAVDQLVLDSGLEFIPNDLSNIRIIVSTLPEWQAKYVKLFKLRIMASEHGQYFINLRALNRTQMKDAYEQFKTKNKILTQRQDQQDVVLRKLMVSPLSFKIMLESSKQWRSYDNPESLVALGKLGANPSEAVKHFFVSLQSQQHLVKLSLGLLSASREGVNEGDLLDILSNHLLQNLEFKKTVINEFYKEPMKIPDSVWLRLHADLEAYLTQRSVNGIIKLALFHRIFNQVALEYASDVFNVRQILINYYKDLLASKNNLDATYRLNAYRELCYQYSNDGQFELAFALLLDQEFIYLLAGTNDSAQLVGEYNKVYRSYLQFSHPKQPINYQRFCDFYSWLLNNQQVLESRNKELFSLWDILAQLDYDNSVAIVPTHKNRAPYYCQQSPTIKPIYGKILSKIEDIDGIVGVFKRSFNLTHNGVVGFVDHTLVLTSIGNTYIKMTNQKDFMLIASENIKITGTIDDNGKIIAWNDELVFEVLVNVDSDKSQPQCYNLVIKRIVNCLNLVSVTNTVKNYILYHQDNTVQVYEKLVNHLIYYKLNLSSCYQILFDKPLYLNDNTIYNLNSRHEFGTLLTISQWYQSPYCVEIILGWQHKDIYLLSQIDYQIIKLVYNRHRSQIKKIYGLQNSHFLSLSADGELHYWNESGICLGIFRSNLILDIASVCELSGNRIIIWNQRGIAIDIDLSLDFDQIDVINTTNQPTILPTIEQTTNDHTELHKDFVEWCQSEGMIPDISSCKNTISEYFSFIDVKNNQILFVQSCSILGVMRYSIINQWVSIGLISQVISNDENEAKIIVNSEEVTVTRYQQRSIRQSKINKLIYTCQHTDELVKNQDFINLLATTSLDELNQYDDFGLSSIFYALDKDDKTLVELLIKHGAEINTSFSNGMTPLIAVINCGNIDMINHLIKLNVDVNFESHDGSALIFASKNGASSEIIKLLLFARADANFVDGGGLVSLLYVSQSGCIDIVKLLLEAGADINAVDNYGKTALMYASQNEHVDVVEFLLSIGAEVNQTDNYGRTALLYAAGKNNSIVVQTLLKYNVDIMARAIDDSTSLMQASLNGCVEIVELLLEAKADFKAVNDNGRNALMLASQNGNVEVIQTLISVYVDINSIDNSGATPLILASQNGRVDTVQMLLLSDADVNIVDKNGWTALILASQQGQSEIVRMLLSANVDFDAVTHTGATALMLASQNGHVEVIQMLLSAGAEVNILEKNGATALMLASQNGHTEVVQILLSANADFNIVADDGKNALMWASKNGRTDIVQLLLSEGIDFNAVTDNGISALLLASEHGHVKVVRILLFVGLDVNSLDRTGWSSLMYASQNCHLQVVQQLLLTENINHNIVGDNGVNALTLASLMGHVDVVQMLLSYEQESGNLNNHVAELLLASQNGHLKVVEALLAVKAKFNIANSNGSTPIMLASQFGHTEIVKILLSAGAVLTDVSNDGWTALMLASQNGHADVVQLLLSHDVNIDIVITRSNVTALMLASQNGHTEVVQILLSANADFNIISDIGWTALMLASQNGHVDIVQILLSVDASINIVTKDESKTVLMLASQCDHAEIVQILLCKGVDINAVDHSGGTALIIASQFGCEEVIKILLSHSADCNIADVDGWTALHLASQNGSVEIVQMLLSAGAAYDVIKKDGVTPLMYASVNGNIKVIESLLSAGASVTIKARNGETALIVASSNGHVEVVTQLLAVGASIKDRMNGMTALQIAQANNHPEVVKVLLNHQRGNDQLINNEKDESIIMKKNEFYTELFTEMMHKGYYDPAASYANRNTKILTALSETGAVDGVFYFTLSTNIGAALAIIAENNYFQIMTKLSGQGVPKELLLEIINNAVNKMNMPVISVDEEGNFLFEYLVFTPCSVNSAISSIDWFNTAFSNFLEVLQQ